MGDRVEVDDTGEELVLLVGCRGPIGNLFQELSIASIRIIEAGSVDQYNPFPFILKRVWLDLAGSFSPSTLEFYYSRGPILQE